MGADTKLDQWETARVSETTLRRLRARAVTVVRVLDTQTGHVVWNGEHNAYYWAEGDGACDCNRERLFGFDSSAGVCLGCKRFVIIECDAPGYTLAEFNEGY